MELDIVLFRDIIPLLFTLYNFTAARLYTATLSECLSIWQNDRLSESIESRNNLSFWWLLKALSSCHPFTIQLLSVCYPFEILSFAILLDSVLGFLAQGMCLPYYICPGNVLMKCTYPIIYALDTLYNFFLFADWHLKMRCSI